MYQSTQALSIQELTPKGVNCSNNKEKSCFLSDVIRLQSLVSDLLTYGVLHCRKYYLLRIRGNRLDSRLLESLLR